MSRDKEEKALLKTLRDRYFITSVAGITDPEKDDMVGKCATAKKWKALFVSDLLEKDMPVDAMALSILETGDGVIGFISRRYNIKFAKE